MSSSSSDSDDSDVGKGKKKAASKKKNPLAGLGGPQKPSTPSALAQTMGMMAAGVKGKKKRGARPVKKQWIHPPSPQVPSSLKSGPPTLGDWEASATLSPSRKDSTGSSNTASSLPVPTESGKRAEPSAVQKADEGAKRKRGRPKGSKNKAKEHIALADVVSAAAEAKAASYNTAEDTDREDEPQPKKRR